MNSTSSPALAPQWNGPDDPAISHAESRFVIGSIFAMALLNLPAALLHLGWKSAAASTALVTIVYLVYAWRRRNQHLLGWMLLALVAGFAELVSDWWLVHGIDSLLYPVAEPHIAASPVYMPFAWMLVLVQGGALAHYFLDRFGIGWAMLATGLVCGLNIPLYESLAEMAGWWTYQKTPMLFHAPYYIIVGEFLLGLPLPFLARAMEKQPLQRAVPLGLLLGVVIYVAYRIAWWLVGPCQGAVVQFSCS